MLLLSLEAAEATTEVTGMSIVVVRNFKDQTRVPMDIKNVMMNDVDA